MIPDDVLEAVRDVVTPSAATRMRRASERFADHVHDRPSHPALVAADARLTYGELDAAVARVCAHLVAAGFRPGDRIGVCLPRRSPTIAAILALLRLGLVYVPLDPAHPPLRIVSVARQAELRAILAEDTVLAALATALDETDALVDVAADVAHAPPIGLIAASTLAAPFPPAGGEDAGARPEGFRAASMAEAADRAIAYIIHTSGSTGRPKGVAIRHDSLANLIDAMAERFALVPSDVVLGTASFGFDMSIVDVIVTFALGATLVLATEAEAPDGHALLALVLRERVTLLQSTPSRLRLMLAAGWQEDAPGSGALRILCGGEALAPALADRLVRRGALWNLYGPTEATVWATARQVRAGNDVALGEPLAGYILRVVDGDGRDASTGAEGELLIGGIGVAECYAGQPEKTAERFFHDVDGVPFYRTGDLVRPRADGRLDFVGRNDHQIKLNGIRIELGEIESVLSAAPAAGEALVMLRDASGDRPTLVGYVTGRTDGAAGEAGGTPPDRRAVERFVAERLPAAMRPRIVVLDRFPLNVNGKIDRAALPAPEPQGGGNAERAGGSTSDAGDAPSSPTARALAAIWCDVLEVKRVSGSDDFLLLGGDSLAATALAGEIGNRFGVHLGVATLLSVTALEAQAAHVEALAADLGAAEAASADAEAPQFVSWNPSGTGTPIWGLHNLLPYRRLAAALGASHPFHAVALSPRVGGEMRRGGSVETIGRAYAEAILGQPRSPEVVVVGWCASGAVALDVARRLRAGGVGVQLIVLVDPEPSGVLAAAIRTLARLRRSLLRGGANATAAGRAVARTSPGPKRGRRKAEQEGFAWLEDALLGHRGSGADAGAVLVAVPQFRNALVAAWRRRVWERSLPPGTRFVTLPGDHASTFDAPGVTALAAAIRETLEG